MSKMAFCFRNWTLHVSNNVSNYQAFIQPMLFQVVQRRNFFYRKKFELSREQAMKTLYKNYDWSLSGIMDFQRRKIKAQIFELQRYDKECIRIQGRDLAAAVKILELGGRVKFVHDPRWLEMGKKKKLPIPTTYREGFHIEGIDASGSTLMTSGLDYLSGLEHLKYINLSGSRYTTDWFVKKIAELCPHLEYLDLSGCQNVTSACLEVAYTMKNLKVLKVTDCVNIQEADVVCDLLVDFVPQLMVVGLETLPAVGDRLPEHEHQTSRYLTWGTQVDIPSAPYTDDTEKTVKVMENNDKEETNTGATNNTDTDTSDVKIHSAKR